MSAWLARGAEAGSGGGASPSAPSPPQSADEWACAACTLLNPAAARTCSVCGALRGSTLPSSSQLASAGGGGATSGGGSSDNGRSQRPLGGALSDTF